MRARASAPELPPTARFARAARSQSQAEEKWTLGACGASQEREGEMDRGGQAPRPASDIKHGKMAVVGLAGHIWPISNTPLMCIFLGNARQRPTTVICTVKTVCRVLFAVRGKKSGWRRPPPNSGSVTFAMCWPKRRTANRRSLPCAAQKTHDKHSTFVVRLPKNAQQRPCASC
jgi:hypothetical protein